MFGISMPELILILAIALIVVGPEKLPDIAKMLGRVIADFKKSAAEFKDSFDVDDEIKDIKKPFDDIGNNIKEIVGVKSSSTKSSTDGQNQKKYDSVEDPVMKKEIEKEIEAESSNKEKEKEPHNNE